MKKKKPKRVRMRKKESISIMDFYGIKDQKKQNYKDGSVKSRKQKGILRK